MALSPWLITCDDMISLTVAPTFASPAAIKPGVCRPGFPRGISGQYGP